MQKYMPYILISVGCTLLYLVLTRSRSKTRGTAVKRGGRGGVGGGGVPRGNDGQGNLSRPAGSDPNSSFGR
jgi:hypothetical protein